MKLVISTIPNTEAQQLAQTLVTEKRVACVNILPAVQSIYRWNGELCHDEESILFMKTTNDKVAELITRIKSLHSYEVPEIISLDIDPNASNPDYIQWIIDSVSP